MNRRLHGRIGVPGRLGMAVLVVVLGVGALSACQPADPNATYVSLGDSYTAGPLITPQNGAPGGCLRSGRDYPAKVSGILNLPHFTDVSCSGATTSDMFNSQGVTPGPANAPQLDALDANTTLVTLGIGGNDIGFSDIVKNCGVSFPWSTPCTGNYVHNGVDDLANKITATEPKIASVLVAIHNKVPKAKVLLVGYPTVLPATGNGCYPTVPILPADVPYLRSVYQKLNAMLADAAAKNGATYVDTATSSVGHDFCAGSNKWVEGLIPDTDAAPVHPNADGMANTATVVAAVAKQVLGL